MRFSALMWTQMIRTKLLSWKYINGTLKARFGLDTVSKQKPVAGPDDLLLLLAQHWARDESVFPTEDDRHDVATIMLFQSYTGGRPAEFFHSSKGKASRDPLGDRETTGRRRDLNSKHNDLDNMTDIDDDCSEHDDDNIDNDLDYRGAPDSGYGTEREETYRERWADHKSTVETQSSTDLLQQSHNDEYNEFGDAIRKYKALCYEDICLWIVQNPKTKGKDVLAMEVHLQHHKGVDNKPKPYIYHYRRPLFLIYN
ncbi:hypothetical protein ACMFMG_004958 [Clarireedia jacksonii]